MLAPVSAIIPCYNSQSTLERAVVSVVKQTLRPTELILIDNCSSDETVALMLELQSRFGNDWIRVIRNETNIGASSSRNRAWNQANQPYVAFLDSDDSWHSRKIEIQYGYMSKHPEKVVTGHGFEILRGKTAEKVIGDSFSIQPRTIRQLLLKNYFVTPGVMVRRNIPERYQENRSDIEDHLLLIELCFQYGAIDDIQLPLAYLYKAQMGEGGLASNLLQMERGELQNIRYLVSKGRISRVAGVALSLFSIAKFVRRIVRVNLQKLRRRYQFSAL